MSLRPAPARWFEMLVMREDLGAAIEVLARSARVELESHGVPGAPFAVTECRELLEEFDALERRFGHHWPAPIPHHPDERAEPYAMLEDAIERLRAWSAAVAEIVDELDDLARERADLDLVHAMVADSAGSLPDLEQLAGAGPMLKTCLYLLTADGEMPQALPASVITRRVATPDRVFLLAVGLPAEVDALEQQLHAQKARPVLLPKDLPATRDAAAAALRERVSATDARIDELRQQLAELDERHDIADALADADFVRWYLSTVPELAATENFGWITGWTSDADGESLLELLADAGVKALLRMAEPPESLETPMLLHNPRWMRPFEVFTGMLGVPAAGEADPTRVVAVASPLMFGFMFGDVGHGAVVLLIGVVLRRRVPALRLLIAGGAVSMVFGLLFGSVFALETLIEPLWLHPLEHPVLMLLLPMAGGAVLLIVGMSLDALQAYWRQQGRFWWQTGAGLVLCYLAALGSLFDRRLLWLALAGALWFIFGHALVVSGKRLAAVGSAAVEFIESIMQLLVNTISFVRVGAFALAHAGLSLAVVGIAGAAGSMAGQILVLIVGNALIIGLEGLVVGIQTTRLVLFEFFIRFLRAEGRPFRPITSPASIPPREYRRH